MIRGKNCISIFLRPAGVFYRLSLSSSAWRCFSATTTQLFSQRLFSHFLCSFLETFYTNNNICNFWHSPLQQVSNHAFCSWDDIFTQAWNCSSRNSLCKITEYLPTLSTNTSIEWNLYFSWSSNLVTSPRLEMNVGGFSKHQNKTSDTDRHMGFFSVVSLKSIGKLWKEFLSSGLNCRLINVCRFT